MVLHLITLSLHEYPWHSCVWLEVLTGRENAVNELLASDHSSSLSVLTTKEIDELQFVRSVPGDVSLSPDIEVEIPTALHLQNVGYK